MRHLVKSAVKQPGRRDEEEEDVVLRCAQVSESVRALEREKQMGKLQKFEITFDQTKTVYSPGESISGKVTVKLDQPLQCKGESFVFFDLPALPRLALNKEVVESPLRELFVKACLKFQCRNYFWLFEYSRFCDTFLSEQTSTDKNRLCQIHWHIFKHFLCCCRRTQKRTSLPKQCLIRMSSCQCDAAFQNHLKDSKYLWALHSVDILFSQPADKNLW